MEAIHPSRATPAHNLRSSVVYQHCHLCDLSRAYKRHTRAHRHRRQMGRILGSLGKSGVDREQLTLDPIRIII